MPAQTANLFLLQDLQDSSRTGPLADSDLGALRAVAGWITTFVVRPHQDLGRAGTVCPFVPGSLERKVLWLAPEPIAGRDGPDVVPLMNGYKRRLLETQPTGGDDAGSKVIVVVFTCRLIGPRASLTASCSILRFRRTRPMESCPGRTTKATSRPRFTTRGSGHSSRRCRFCS
jgi:hypothetical protein